jgi:hypothetical protein
MVVCPAGLTTKWRDEIADKFGLGRQVTTAIPPGRIMA